MGRIKKLVPPSYGSEEFAVKFLEWLKGLLKIPLVVCFL